MKHHGAGLRALVQNDALVEALLDDYRRADLSSADRAMLDYAVRLTLEPWAMTRRDLEPLRSAGFDDRAILDINQVSAYYAYVNRLADGLGVELEPSWSEGESSDGSPRGELDDGATIRDES